MAHGRFTNRKVVVVNVAAAVTTLALAAVCFGGGRPGYFGGAKQCFYDGLYRACPARHAPESGVYALVVDSLYFGQAGGRASFGGDVLLEARTAAGDATDTARVARALAAAAPEAVPVLPALLDGFVRANASPAALGRLTMVMARQRRLDSAAVARWFDPADSVGVALDPGDTVPPAGLLTLSRVAFDRTGTWALVWAACRDRDRRGRGTYVLLQLRGERWHLVAAADG
jgi:hypothetical protein